MKAAYFLIIFLFSSNLYSQSESCKLALDLFEKQEYTEAIKLATMAIESNKNDCEAYLVRGASYKEMNELALSMDNLLFSIKCDSTNFMAYSYLADIYAAYGDLNMAIVNYTKSIELNKAYFFNFLDRAICKKELGKYNEAIQDLQIAISLDSMDQEVFGLLGEIYIHLKKYDFALEHLNQSISLAPNGLNSTLKGIALANLENYAEAIDSFTKALEYKDANIAGLHIYRGKMYLYLNKKTQACLDFKIGYELGDMEGLDLQKEHCK